MEAKNNLDNIFQEIQTMQGEGFVFEKEKIEQEVQSDQALYSNLAVKILSILGGIIGSIFFIGFIVLSLVQDSDVGLLLLGSIFLVGSIVMGRVEKSVFLDTVNICAWLIGGGLIIGGLFSNGQRESVVAIISLIVAAITFFTVNRFLLKFFSVLVICGCMVVLILLNDWYNLIHFMVVGCGVKMTFLHLTEAEVISKNKFFNESYYPLRMGLVISFISLLMLVGKGGRMTGLFFENLWIVSLVIIGCILFSMKKIMDGLDIEKEQTKMMVLILSGVMLLPTVFAPSISGAILILILNYHLGYRTGIALGVISMVYFVIQYYYDLNFTLLEKSGILVLSGILFLVAYFIFSKKIKTPTHEEI